MNEKRAWMTEERYWCHDTAVKWLTLVLAIIGASVAYCTYIDQHNQARTQADAQSDATLRQNREFETTRRDQAEKDANARRQEYARHVWEKQLDLYLDACKAASTLATADSPKHPEYAQARLQFLQLFYGELCVVESNEVALKMIDFRNALFEYEKNPTTINRSTLMTKSIDLARACRASTAEQWQVKLGTVNVSPPNPKIPGNL